ncbi:MAG: GNAT family N-acetyltransferase [Clostridiales Family XIII bacterium]|jgi:ribosomal protein S18 acetylase RimI-like enzyme|nr:GNAT family N-acetyltransferase [Clostridiales Family XIII bacterium]
MAIRIAFAAREEIPDIAALILAAWRSAYRDILPADYLASLSLEERCAGYGKLFDAGHTRFLTLHDGGELIGASVLGRSTTQGYPDDGEVSAIYLREDRIGKGYGHALFEKAEQTLAEMGYTDFILDVFTQNARAIRFYEAHGYEKIEERNMTIDGIDYPPYAVFRKVRK